MRTTRQDLSRKATVIGNRMPTVWTDRHRSRSNPSADRSSLARSPLVRSRRVVGTWTTHTLLRGPVNRIARRWIDAKKPGRIINIASFAGVVADPMSAPYAATKGAVVQLTRTCAVEWAQHGILVNAIGPGYIRTEMTAHTLDQPSTGAVIRAKTALGRAGTTAEVAGAAVFLAAPASSYVTGHVLMVDGGWTAW